MSNKYWLALGGVLFIAFAGAIWLVWQMYFGVDEAGTRLFRVRNEDATFGGDLAGKPQKVSQLMGTDRVTWQSSRRDINLGFCVHKPTNRKLWGDPGADFSRMATTYFNRLGPVGRVMERWNWFPGPANTYAADARLPASLVATAAPLSMLTTLWSEPPVAIIGLECGTMASYARPYQHIHFFEKYPVLRDLSFPPTGKQAAFTFVPDATARGAALRVFPGDPRATMQKPHTGGADGGAGDNFYHAIVITAFYTQEIPTNLLTREAMQMYFRKLVPDGILCIHTSNRYYDTIKALTATAESIELPNLDDPQTMSKLACVRGHDMAPANDRGAGATHNLHFSSEWLMIARERRILDGLTVPPDYEAKLAASSVPGVESYWESPASAPDVIWTDASANVNAVRRK